MSVGILVDSGTLDKSPAGNAADLRAFRVQGDCMEPTLSHGSLVSVEPWAASAELADHDGEVVLAQAGDHLIVKRLQAFAGGPMLCPDNPAYRPLPLDGYRIVGTVVECWHSVGRRTRGAPERSREATTREVIRRLSRGEPVGLVAVGTDGTFVHRGHTRRMLTNALAHYNAHVHVFADGAYRGELDTGLTALIAAGLR